MKLRWPATAPYRLLMPVKDDERRQFRRIQAPVYCRPVGFRLFAGRQKAVDISLGGVRIFSDDDVKKGTRLELELFLPDTSSVVCKVEVVWVDPLPEGAPAKFDVGLKFLEIAGGDKDKLSLVLDPT